MWTGLACAACVGDFPALPADLDDPEADAGTELDGGHEPDADRVIDDPDTSVTPREDAALEEDAAPAGDAGFDEQDAGEDPLDAGGDLADLGVEPDTGPPELCNFIDDDMDGATDEDFGIGEPCTVGAGVCEATGERVCGPDGEGRCSVEPGPSGAETCNDLDDDCDGFVDEDTGRDGMCVEGIGACERAGTRLCDPESELALCDALPGMSVAEQCNFADDDCDGRIDEDTGVNAPCIVGTGLCARGGFQACADDGGLRCEGEAGDPFQETCDRQDEDCDGRVDEDTGLGEDCVVGVGECARAGVRVCTDEGGTRCDGTPGQAAPAEACNELDDDCDGETDEGLGLGDVCEVGIGECRTVGRLDCGENGGVICRAPPTNDEPESCNGLDDDCDGRTDEGFPVGLDCEAGVGACLRVAQFICDGAGAAICPAEPGLGGMETCNAVDDDCDGRTDEGFAVGEPCDVGVGACLRQGEQVCLPNGDLACDARPGQPVDEICDGLDNDCDGSVDEDVPASGQCAAGQGACRREGALECNVALGELECTATPAQPGNETCNGVDDDCDGPIDEGFGTGTPCEAGEGLCARAGQRVCDGGEVVCNAEPGDPEDETCNGQDDDCDGSVDEGRVCGAFIAGHCRAWLGIANADTRVNVPSATWSECNDQNDTDHGGRARCVGTRLNERFRQLPTGIDVNSNDQMGLRWTCDDDQLPQVANWVETHCAIYLGHADVNGGENDPATWPPCPGQDEGNAGATRCTSSGRDGLWHALDLVGDVNQDDDFAIAFQCRDDADPDRADGASEAVQIVLGWARDQRRAPDDNSETWAGCPDNRRTNGNGDDTKCVSSNYDRKFHKIDMRGDVDAFDYWGIGVFARD
jgi:hypothetical protein